METNLIASFNNLDRLEQAVGALREQGAIDIRVSPTSVEPAGHSNAVASQSRSQEMKYSVNVYVERSRCRQAEDTILRYGGHFQSGASY